MVGLSPPVMPDVGVIALVPDGWNSPWRARHQLLTRLSHYFHVVWMDPAQGWRESWFGSKPPPFTLPQEMPSFSVCPASPFLPQFYKPRMLRSLTERLRLQQAARILRKRGCEKVVLYLWRPEFAPALDLLAHDFSLYHIVDEYSFSDVEQPLCARESALVRRVDQVIIHSKALMEKKGHLNPSTISLPNGVDYAAYAAPQSEPSDLRDIPHPRIGYVGVIKKQLDFTLLLNLAKNHPQWSYVFVGPQGYLGDQAARVAALREMPNVYFLGEKKVSELPAYTQHLDVGMMCYQNNGYTKFIYPLKLHEYLASGLPVVGTDIRSLQEFSGSVRLAQNEAEWSAALQEALMPAARVADRVAARRAVAREYDWNRIAGSLAHSIGRGLGRSAEERQWDPVLL